ncbi:NAD-dependent epimerase/dehydratase family protein [Burkholderia sp. Bp8992]|uniref:AMP-binding protein n=1 Tax=Burkholderia sp. Bp8992 TaxID=2184554 RepID=UPI000F58C443|nr:AMP-binding protein [Burkholderia sp. Bp8992]RQS26589.1 NAD-dependent epimerase/dehydratase family protein [Burkholderia sp. Bp8992]
MREQTIPCLESSLFEIFACHPEYPVLVNRQHHVDRALFRQWQEEAEHLLREWGAGAQHVVELCLPRSYQLVVLAVACLSMRVPFFVTNPHETESVLARDRERLKPFLTVSLAGDGETEAVSVASACRFDTHTQFACTDWQDIAYLARSSGSTGEPKFSRITRQGLANLIHEQGIRFGLRPGAVVGLASSVSFDAIFSEIFVSLFNGCTLFILDARDNALVQSLKRDIGNLSHLTLTPSVAVRLDPESLGKLETLVLAGEPIPQNLLSGIPDHVAVINAYGPCEATVCTHTKQIGRIADNNVGEPLGRLRAYIADPAGEALPAGSSGLVVISGLGVGAGYVGQVVTTNPEQGYFRNSQGELVFNTGDLGQINEKGELLLLGRSDAKVKVRGQQLHLRGIEALVTKITGIDLATLTVEDDGLCLHYEGSLPDTRVRTVLKESLPRHALPRHYVKYERMPLNAAGKIDRRSLTPTVASGVAEGIGMAAEIFAKVLGRALSEHQDFFENGGDSLLITELMVAFEGRVGKELDLDKFLDTPTIAGLSAQIGAPLAASSNGLEQAFMEFDVHLATIRAAASELGARLDPPRSPAVTVFLTGGTGIIGREVLAHLARNGGVRVIAATRNPRTAAELVELGASECVEVDLNSLSLEQGTRLLRDHAVTHVIHAAAEVNHVYPLATLFAPNVKATSLLLHSALLAACTQFIYLGSSSAQDDPKRAQSAYDISKWMAQELVRGASGALDTKVLSLPLVVGEKSRQRADRDHMTARIRQCLEMGQFPVGVGDIDAVSAGFVAEMIDEVMRYPALWGSFIEVNSSETVSFDEVLLHAANLTSSPVSSADPEEFGQNLRAWFSNRPECPLAPFSSIYNQATFDYLPVAPGSRTKTDSLKRFYETAKSSHRSAEVMIAYLEDVLV